MNIPSFSRILTRVRPHHTGGRTTQLVNPPREWFTALLVTITVLLAGLLYSAHLFVTEITTDHLAARSSDATPEAYKHGTVDRALTTFGARAATFTELEANRPAPVAPSATSTDEVAEDEALQVE